MSLKDEIEELVGWLAQLTEKPSDKPPQGGRVTYHSWHLVVGRLSAARIALIRASDGLRAAADATSELDVAERAKNPGLSGVLSEVAADLARECEDLRRRAMVRRGLAPKADTDDESAPEIDDEDSVDHDTETPEKPAPSGKRVLPDANKHGVQLADGRLRGAQKSLTTAMGHLAEGTDDQGAASFAEELDVLAEMVLGLRRRVDEISEIKGSAAPQGGAHA